MANFTAADVKRLREITASGMMACKEAPVSYTHLTLPTNREV